MRVSVSGKQFAFPRSCVCCGAYPLTHLSVSGAEKNRKARTQGWTWDVPYCVACKGHVLWAERILLFSLLLDAVAFLSGFATAVMTGRWALGLELLAFLLVVSSLLGWVLWQYVRGQRPDNCRGMARAMIYLGSNGPCHSFEIRSGFYAAEFVRANHRKLVNASPQIVSILRGTSFGDHQVPRRIVRGRK